MVPSPSASARLLDALRVCPTSAVPVIVTNPVGPTPNKATKENCKSIKKGMKAPADFAKIFEPFPKVFLPMVLTNI